MNKVEDERISLRSDKSNDSFDENDEKSQIQGEFTSEGFYKQLEEEIL